MHIAVDTLPRTHGQLSDIFEGNTFAGSTIIDGRAAVFTDRCQRGQIRPLVSHSTTWHTLGLSPPDG
eukprot:2052070-Pyramimonas_sp.AAC.1